MSQTLCIEDHSMTSGDRMVVASFNIHITDPVVVRRSQQPHSQASAVQRLPPEILVSIFHFASQIELGGGFPTPPPPWQHTPTYLLATIIRVCRMWRAAATGDSSLWATLLVSADAPHHVTVFTAHLARAGPVRGLRLVRWADGNPVAPALAGLLAAHAHRWARIEVHGRGRCGAAELRWLARARCAAGALEALVLGCRFTDVEGVEDVFCGAPGLRRVDLVPRDGHSCSPPSLVLPWAQLTHYSARYSMGRHLEILREATRLVECAVLLPPVCEQRAYYGAVSRGGEKGTICLPNLLQLSTDDASFLGFITTPNVTHLSLEFRTQGTAECAMLVSFLEQCNLHTQLRALCLVNLAIEHLPAIITSVLPLIPDIRALEVRDKKSCAQFRSMDALFQALTVQGQSPAACPQLEDFSYGFFAPCNQKTDLSALHAMVISRSRNHSVTPRLEVWNV